MGMKHLYEYEEQDVQGLMKDLEKVGHGPMKGWILSVVPFDTEGSNVGTTYYAIAAGTIEEAYAMVAEDWIPEMEDPINPESWGDLLEKIEEILEWETGAKLLAAWEGLTCRKKDPTIEVIRSASPFDVINMLNKEFTNVQSVMSTSPKGNTE
jgi:hypothetical protein